MNTRTKSNPLPNYIKAIRLRAGKPVVPKEKVVVGVLTTPRQGSHYLLPYGRDARLKKEMTATAKAHGIFLFFFYPEGFHMGNDTVVGHALQTNKRGTEKWITGVFRRPDIVYNRLSYRKNEVQRDIHKLLIYLQNHPQIKLFNRRFLHKWEVYKSLVNNSSTCDLVPETRLFNLSNLDLMLHKYPQVFVKPMNNSVGKGIRVVRRNRAGTGYEYKPAGSDNKWKSCKLIRSLYLNLKAGMTDSRQYLIQRGLHLSEIDGRIFDLRAQVQKNGCGEWVLTGVGVRVAAPNKYVTHVPNGGSRADYDQIMMRVCNGYPRCLKNLEVQLIRICNTVPTVLEKALGMNLGILSIDIGLEQNGIMQVIEVNSKPASFDEDHIRQRHLEYLNQYFLYLSKS